LLIELKKALLNMQPMVGAVINPGAP